MLRFHKRVENGVFSTCIYIAHTYNTFLYPHPNPGGGGVTSIIETMTFFFFQKIGNCASIAEPGYILTVEFEVGSMQYFVHLLKV